MNNISPIADLTFQIDVSHPCQGGRLMHCVESVTFQFVRTIRPSTCNMSHAESIGSGLNDGRTLYQWLPLFVILISIFYSTRLDHFLNGFGVAFDEVMRIGCCRAEEQGSTISLLVKHVKQRRKSNIIYRSELDSTFE